MNWTSQAPARGGDDRTRADGTSAHYLYPGSVHASAEPCIITTILATCVAVCLWDPKTRVGGANHFLLPHYQGSGGSGPGSARFGTAAFEQLYEKVQRAGADPRRLRAKIFGGMQGRAGLSNDLGARNAELAERVLAERRIPVDAADLGGERSRKLIFHTHDGVALVTYF